MAEVCIAESDRKLINFVCQKKEAQELEWKALQLAASLYGDNQSHRRH